MVLIRGGDLISGGGFVLYCGLPLNPATLGTSQSVLIRGVASFQESFPLLNQTA